MDWQATEFNNSWRYAFTGLVRNSPEHQDPAQLAAGIANWNRHVSILETQLARTRAYATGAAFTLADIVLGLSVHRWLVAPIERPELPAIRDYHARLLERTGFQRHLGP
jgi:glutathione S-transferase